MHISFFDVFPANDYSLLTTNILSGVRTNAHWTIAHWTNAHTTKYKSDKCSLVKCAPLRMHITRHNQQTYILCFLSSFSSCNDNFNNVSILTRHNRCKRINTYTYTYNVMSQHCQNVNIICSLEKCSRLRMHITRHD